jgi:hypothetical protein
MKSASCPPPLQALRATIERGSAPLFGGKFESRSLVIASAFFRSPQVPLLNSYLRYKIRFCRKLDEEVSQSRSACKSNGASGTPVKFVTSFLSELRHFPAKLTLYIVG